MAATGSRCRSNPQPSLRRRARRATSASGERGARRPGEARGDQVRGGDAAWLTEAASTACATRAGGRRLRRVSRGLRARAPLVGAFVAGGERCGFGDALRPSLGLFGESDPFQNASLGEAREGGEVLLRSGMGRQGRGDPGRIGDGVDAEGEGGRGSERTAVMSHKLQSLTSLGCSTLRHKPQSLTSLGCSRKAEEGAEASGPRS